MATRRFISTPISLSRRRGQVLMAGNNRRMPGIAPGDQPTKPGQTNPKPPVGGEPFPGGAWQRNNHQPAAPAAVAPPQALLGGRFGYGENNNKILDTGHGVYTPEQARQYQLLFNWAQQHGANIVGQSGEGGGYNPNVLYAQPNRYVDMRTGLANPPNTGASADTSTAVSPAVLARLQKNAGYDPAQAAATAHSNAVGMGPAGLSNWQLGSDGQYHDTNQPLPPGVDLTPPEGATAPLTQGVDQVAEAGHGTPQAALAAGNDPTKHIAYWESKGWSYNPATDQWTNRNATPTQPGQTPPIIPGQTVPVPQDTGAGVPGGGTMPLDPAYIAAQRAAQTQLDTTLAGTNPALEQIQAQQNLATARLGTNAANDQQALMESLAGRGVLQSSLYGTGEGNLATNYLRLNQDLAANVASAYSGVYQQQQDAYNTYQQNLIEALLAAGNNAETSSYTPVGNVRTRPKKKKKPKKGNNRG